jgi:hypothetical protein
MKKIRKDQQDAIFEAIGRLVAEWSGFENDVNRAITRLAGIEGSIGALVTARLDNSSRMQLFDAPSSGGDEESSVGMASSLLSSSYFLQYRSRLPAIPSYWANSRAEATRSRTAESVARSLGARRSRARAGARALKNAPTRAKRRNSLARVPLWA